MGTESMSEMRLWLSIADNQIWTKERNTFKLVDHSATRVMSLNFTGATNTASHFPLHATTADHEVQDHSPEGPKADSSVVVPDDLRSETTEGDTESEHCSPKAKLVGEWQTVARKSRAMHSPAD